MKKNFATGLLFCVSVIHTAVIAEPTTKTAGSMSAMMLQTLFGLATVILAIFLLAWAAKKLSAQGGGKLHGLNLLAVMPLGSKEKAVLIEVAGKKLLLGVAPGRVNALHVFDQSELDTEFDAAAKEKSEPEKPETESAISEQMKPKARSPMALSARTTSEFSQKLHSFLSQGIRRP